MTADATGDPTLTPGQGRDEQIFPPPALLPAVPPASTGVFGNVAGAMDAMDLSHMTSPNGATGNLFELDGSGSDTLRLSGNAFDYDSSGHLVAGTVSSIFFTDTVPGGTAHVTLGVLNLPAASFAGWIAADATQQAFSAVLGGNDQLQGGFGADLIRGYGGNDVIEGQGGSDTIWGGDGNDQIYAGHSPSSSGGVPTGSTYLRGEDGNDYIIGGAGFDDINGNQGNDTCAGGAGDDWVVGGKGDDVLFGQAGDDIVLGNLGDDTLDGGDGNDVVRGGQGDDFVNGGPGNDFISGDRGNDTETGGPGADIFHGSQDAGIDRIEDFHVAENDRVMLDPGTTYTVSQVGADTVIDMGGANQMILVGVQMSSLPAGTIFLG